MSPRVLSTLFFLSLCLAAPPALANEPAPRLSFGLRTGFGQPMGLLQGGDGHENQPLKDRVSGIIPLQLNAGLFFNSRLYLGTSVQYAHALLPGGCPPHISEGCSAFGLRLGVTLSYHLPGDYFDPWFGLGAGYDLLRPWNHSFHGLEVFNVQGGADFHASGPLWLGPFVTFTAGQYLNVNDPQSHYWLMGGLRISIRPAARTPSPGIPEEAGGDSTMGSGSRVARITAGLLLGTGAGALGAIPGSLLWTRTIFSDSSSGRREQIGLLLAVGGMIGGSALGIDFVGGALGGQGSIGPTALGTLLGALGGILAGAALMDRAGDAGLFIPAILGPTVGGVIAYEISHSIAVGEIASRPRFVPLMSVGPRGGLIGGLAGRF